MPLCDLLISKSGVDKMICYAPGSVHRINKGALYSDKIRSLKLFYSRFMHDSMFVYAVFLFSGFINCPGISASPRERLV